DLARQVSKVLSTRSMPTARRGHADTVEPRACPPKAVGMAPKRIAITAPRFGDGFAGGAEASLRLLAGRMRAADHHVEIFTLGDADGSTTIDGLPVHRFRADPVDATRRAAAAHAIKLAQGQVDAETETAFLANSPSSSRLIGALRERGPFDA